MPDAALYDGSLFPDPDHLIALLAECGVGGAHVVRAGLGRGTFCDAAGDALVTAVVLGPCVQVQFRLAVAVPAATRRAVKVLLYGVAEGETSPRAVARLDEGEDRVTITARHTFDVRDEGLGDAFPRVFDDARSVAAAVTAPLLWVAYGGRDPEAERVVYGMDRPDPEPLADFVDVYRTSLN